MNGTVFLDSAGVVNPDSSAVVGSLSGGVGNVQVSITPTQFSCADIGSQPVLVVATDGAGQSDSCQTTVTVSDSLAPLLVCKDITLVLPEEQEATVLLEEVFDQENSFDNCGIAFFVLSQLYFDCSHLGQNTLQFLGFDESGNVGLCESEVYVAEDFLNPSTCTDVTVSLDASGFAQLQSQQILTADLSAWSCESSLDLTVTPSQFSCADIGSHQVTLTAAAGGVVLDSCQVNASVVDQTPPTAVCAPDTVTLGQGQPGAVQADRFDAGSTDGCSGVLTFSANQITLSCQALGTNPVMVVVSDAFGNTDTCETFLTVQDPQQTCGEGICPPQRSLGSGALQSGQYRAASAIQAAGSIQSGAEVTFSAGDSIVLLPGFQAPAGCRFSAIIESCTVTPPGGGGNAENPAVASGFVDSTSSRKSDSQVSTPASGGAFITKMFPNPFIDECSVEFSIEKQTHISLSLTSLSTGQIIQTEAPRIFEAGTHRMTIDGSRLPQGVYVLALTTDWNTQAERIVKVGGR